MITIGLININEKRGIYYLLKSIRKIVKVPYKIQLIDTSADPLFCQIDDVEKINLDFNSNDWEYSKLRIFCINKLIEMNHEDLIILDSNVLLRLDLDLFDNREENYMGNMYEFLYINCRKVRELTEEMIESKQTVGYTEKYEDGDYIKFLYDNQDLWKTNYYDVIVSLTTWKGRIHDNTTMEVLQSLKNQECRYNYKVVLVLSEAEFHKIIPDEISNLQSDNFEILWTYENTRPLKKLDPTYEKYPDLPIITLDDDDLCDPDAIEKVYEEHINDPWTVLGTLCEPTISYCKWVAGVRLFPPKCLYSFPIVEYYQYYDGILDDNFNAMRNMFKGYPVKGINPISKKHNQTDIKLTNEYQNTEWNTYYKRFILNHLHLIPEELFYD